MVVVTQPLPQAEMWHWFYWFWFDVGIWVRLSTIGFNGCDEHIMHAPSLDGTKQQSDRRHKVCILKAGFARFCGLVMRGSVLKPLQILWHTDSRWFQNTVQWKLCFPLCFLVFFFVFCMSLNVFDRFLWSLCLLYSLQRQVPRLGSQRVAHSGSTGKSGKTSQCAHQRKTWMWIWWGNPWRWADLCWSLSASTLAQQFALKLQRVRVLPASPRSGILAESDGKELEKNSCIKLLPDFNRFRTDPSALIN